MSAPTHLILLRRPQLFRLQIAHDVGGGLRPAGLFQGLVAFRPGLHLSRLCQGLGGPRQPVVPVRRVSFTVVTHRNRPCPRSKFRPKFLTASVRSPTIPKEKMQESTTGLGVRDGPGYAV